MTAKTAGGAERKVYRDTNLQIIFGITLMAVLGVSSVTPAFPTIARELGLSAQKVGLLITAFTLPGVILVPIWGVIADRYGRKTILIPALLLFSIAGTACFFARDFHVLLMLRLLQGMGGGSLGSINTTLIGDLYSGPYRPAAMGYNASVLSIGTAGYPLIGGALASIAWYYPFVLPVFALPVALLVLFKLKTPAIHKPEDMREYFRGVRRSITKQVVALFFASTFTFVILYGSYLTYYPFLVRNSFGGSPVVIGLLMSVMSFTTAITSFQLGTLAQKYTGRRLLLIGFSFYTVSLVLIPLMPTIWLLILPTIVFGLGHGIIIPSILTLMSDFAPMEHRAAFMSMNSMVLRLGQTVGPIVMGTAFAVSGTYGAFWAGAGLSVVTFFVIVLSLRSVAAGAPEKIQS